LVYTSQVTVNSSNLWYHNMHLVLLELQFAVLEIYIGWIVTESADYWC